MLKLSILLSASLSVNLYENQTTFNFFFSLSSSIARFPSTLFLIPLKNHQIFFLSERSSRKDVNNFKKRLRLALKKNPQTFYFKTLGFAVHAHIIILNLKNYTPRRLKLHMKNEWICNLYCPTFHTYFTPFHSFYNNLLREDEKLIMTEFDDHRKVKRFSLC